MSGFRSGFVGILGRPNVGKSTLLNWLCGEKLAITSSKPQTTRNRILGVLHHPGSQIVFLDTPGMHETDRAINRYMQQVIAKVAADVDIVVYMADVTRAHGREDGLTLSMLPVDARVPVLLVVNKADLVGPEEVAERVELLERLFNFSGTFITSAITGAGTDQLVEKISLMLPEGVPYFPEDMVTDQPLGFRLAEIVREKLFDLTKDEIPYSTAVVVEHMATREDGLMELSATVFIEKESQKGIIIGKKGSMLQKVGTAARLEMESQLGRKVYLELWVKVKKGWTDREGLLRQMGYE
ncbi:MAG: GTPase Era [bacterium]|nr:GTPase Era [bacterium]MDT8365771.1 GTPase Era [bacterium]